MQLTSPLAKGRLRGDLPTQFCSIIAVSTSFYSLIFFTLSPFSCLQIVSLGVVKKSEATSRECQRNDSTCFWFVKTQGFYGYVYRWLLINCTFIINFYPLFIPLKRPKTAFSGLQKHKFYDLKHHLLHAKSIAFASQNLCFWIFRAVFWPNKRKYFSRLKKWFVTKKENEKCS